jgi:hypothetical protein
MGVSARHGAQPIAGRFLALSLYRNLTGVYTLRANCQASESRRLKCNRIKKRFDVLSVGLIAEGGWGEIGSHGDIRNIRHNVGQQFQHKLGC